MVLEGDAPEAGAVRRGRLEPGPAHAAPGALDELERVGRPAGAGAGGADHEPRHALAGHVLPHGDRGAVAGRRHRRDVEVLAHVVLVGAHGAQRREGGVVGEHDVRGDRLDRGVRQLEVPVPARVLVAEAQDEAVVDALVPTGDDDAVVAGRDRGAGPWAQQAPTTYAVRRVD